MSSGNSTRAGNRRGFWIVVLGSLLLCGLGGFALINGSEGAVRDEVQKLQALGVPVTPEEIKAATHVASGNAAPHYQRAIAALNAVPQRQRWEAVKQLAKWEPGRGVAYAEGWLKTFEPALRHVEEAVKLPAVDYERAWDLGPNLLLPEYQHMRDFAKALAGKSKLLAAKGDVKGALQALDVAGRLSAHTGSEPTIISMLVAISTDTIASYTARQMATTLVNSDTDLEQLLKTLERRPALPNIRSSMSGEVVMGHALFENPDSIGSTFHSASGVGDENLPLDIAFKVPSIRKAAHAKFLRTWRKAFERFPKDPRDWKGYSKVLEATAMDLEKDKSITGQLNALLWPVLAQTAGANGRALADRRMVETGVRLLLDRARTGSLPAALPAYGDSSIDPFTSKPLGYRRTAAGFVLYSVGTDGKDDGGKPMPRSSDSRSAPNQTWDMVWEVDVKNRRSSSGNN